MDSNKELLAFGGAVILMVAVVVGVWIMFNDADGDGLSYIQEKIWKTDPDNHDTDGDSFLDGEEVDRGSNPLDSVSTPPPLENPLPPKEYDITYNNLEDNPVHISVAGGRNIRIADKDRENCKFTIVVETSGLFGIGSRVAEELVVDEKMMKELYKQHFQGKGGEYTVINLKDISTDTKLVDVSLDISQKIRDAGPKVRSTLFDSLKNDFWSSGSNAPGPGDTVILRLYGTSEYEIQKYKFNSLTYRIQSTHYVSDNLLALRFTSASRDESVLVNSRGETIVNSLDDLVKKIDDFYLDRFKDEEHSVKLLPNIYQQINRIDDDCRLSVGSKHYIFLTLGSFVGDKNWPQLDSSHYKWINQWRLNNLSWRKNPSVFVKSDFCTSDDRVTFIGLDYDNNGEFKIVQRNFIDSLFDGCSMTVSDYIYNNN